MSIAIGDDRQLLLDAARRFVDERCPTSAARTAIDRATDELPEHWSALGELGWLALDPAARLDGGLGYSDLAVVLEQLGRTVAPGPALPTTWAVAALSAGSRASDGADTSADGHLDPVATDLLAALRTGRSAGTVALSGSVRATGVRLTGRTGPVLSASVADVVVVPADVDGQERWFTVRLDATDDRQASIEPLASLDGTRPLGRVVLDDAPAVALRCLDRATVEAIGVTLASAEAAGGAAWCVDTAAAYASVRHQFGRPIGQFQAVKHRCADMLVRLEQIRAVAWDAAAALDAVHPSGPSERLATAAAGALAMDGYLSVARDCIQVLGGIGFTWEHDAHLHLRRATAVHQLMRPAVGWRRDLADAAIVGTRRHLHLDLPPGAEAVRAEVAPVVDEIARLATAERRVPLADAGLIVPHWSPPWGRGADAIEQLVIEQELRRVEVRAPHLQVGAWAAPTIAAHGTAEQQERWVRPTLHGTITWCQLFSEPEAGSDLASLTTTATPTDGGWLLNGQKVWTTMAKEADWGICLARTDPDRPKHLGITYFVLDMSSTGIDVRPLREITGLEMFNEVFLDDVFVPDDCVIGEVHGGWPLARTTLANERVSMGSGASFGGGIEALIALVAALVDAGTLPAPPEIVLDRLGGLLAESHSLAVMGLRSTMRSLHGAKPGPEASVRKLLGAEHDQRAQELGLELLGPEGATTVDGPPAQWTFGYLANRCLTIAGGTSEIQRNLIGERLLGLPRDPEPEATVRPVRPATTG